MQRNLLIEAKKHIQSNRRHRVWQKVVRVMAGCVVFCTTYALILPAITMEQEAFCGYEEHTHSEECYVRTSPSLKLTCSPDELELHVHSEGCLDADGNTVCGLADYVAHTHTADCFDENGLVVCAFPEIGQHVHDSSCYSVPETTAQSHTHSDSCYSKEKGELICTTVQQEAHTHTDACYAAEKALVCTTAESAGHAHSDSCYTAENVLTCTTAESAGHTHADECYDAEGTLVCTADESAGHTHGDGCYTVQQNLTCGQAEQEAHTHGDSCYETPIVCGLIETEGHAHTDACYAWNETVICGLEETPIPEPELICTAPIAKAHVHSADCFETIEEPLTCQLEESEEHTHTDLCYGTWKLACPKEEHTHELICFSDPEADLETAQVWEKTFKDVELTGVWADDVLAIAKTQLGYAESTRNYEVWEDGTTHGYTRYGDWYGSPYGDWCAMFVSFCIHYAEIDGVPLNWGCRTWIEELSRDELDLYREAGEYDPKPGDIIFFDWEDENGDSDDLADHVGLVAELIPATGTEPAKIKTIEGNSSNQVKYNKYDADDTEILGYGIMPENPELEAEEETETVTAQYTYSDDNVYVEVQLPEDTDVPADAVLTVTPIASDDEGYDAYVAQAEEAVDGTVANIALYDISFYTADGTYYPVDDTAKVTMGFVESPVDTTANVQVLHFAEEGAIPEVIENVTVGEKEIEMVLEDAQLADTPAAAALEQQPMASLFSRAMPAAPAETEPEVQTLTETRTVVEFETDGFSTFAVIELTSMYQTVQGITGLEGKSYIIAAVNNGDGNFNADGTPKALPVMTSTQNTDGNRTELVKRSTASVEYIDNKVTSVALTDYTGAVWTFEKAGTDTYYIKSSGEQYLSITNENNSLTLSGDTQEFRVVAATDLNANNGDAMNAVCIETDVNGATFRVNLVTNGSDNNFTSWNSGTGARDNHLVLVEYIEPQTTNLTDLDGKSYIIAAVNFAKNGNADEGAKDNFNDDGTRKALPVMTSVAADNNTRLQRRPADSFVYSANGNVTSVTLTDYTNAVWTFEKAGNGTYHIKSSQGQYLSIPGKGQLTLSDNNQEFRVVTATGANTTGDAQNAVCIETDVDGNIYLVNLAANDALGQNFTSWDSGINDRGNHLVLIEYEAHQVTMPVISDDAVNNLAGKKLVITKIGGVAITGNTLNTYDDDTFNDRLEAAGVTVAGDKSTVTISSESSADLVWEFEAAKDQEGNIITGQYYIKHVATGKYLHLFNKSKANDKPLTLVDNKQAIEVLSANDNNNRDAVWIRCPISNLYEGGDGGNSQDYNCIDLHGNVQNDGFGVWNKSPGTGLSDSNKFLLSEYKDLPMMDAVDATVAANNLDGKTMVITAAANYNVAMSNIATTDNDNRGWLKAQETTEKNGTLGVASDTKLADVSWKFTSVPNGQANQYYITDSTEKYLNINGTSVALSGNKQPISVYENNDGTFVLYVNQNGQDYLLDFSRGDNAFSAWDRAHDGAEGNNKFKLTPVDQFDKESEVVTNLAGKTLALISIYDANWNETDGYTTPQLALTSGIYYDGLHGIQVTMNPNTDGKAYTFDDTKFTNNEELWTFEAVDNKLGVYYIKAANGNYLNLGDGSATVSNTKQEITVLSDTYIGLDGITYEGVYLRAEVNGVEVYLRREFDGNGDKLFGDDVVDENGTKISERNFVLAQPSTIYIDVYTGLDLGTNEDWLYKPHFGDEDDLGNTYKEETVLNGGKLPTSGELHAEPKDHVKGTNPNQHFVYFNFAESMDPYTAGKGRDFPQAYMASWAPALDKNGNGYIDQDERGDTNGDGKVDDQDDSKAKEEFIQTLKENVYDPDNFKGESPYWGVELELTHYEVTLPNGSTLKDPSGNNVKFAPGAEYSVTADGKIAITDVNGQVYSIPFGSTFKAQYIEFSDILTFYINLYGVVADVAADIQPRYIEDFTLGLAIAHIYYPGKYAGDTTEDYNKSNEYINSLFKGAYGENVEPGVMHAVIDGYITRSGPENRGNDNLFSNDPDNQRYLSNPMKPALGASATALAAHVLDYVRTVPDINIMLKNYVSGNGEDTPTLNNKTIDTATFEVRWYVVKDQGDSWHIDGVTIGKTEPIPVTKYFYGLQDADVNDRVSYERTDTNISGETDYLPTNNYQIGVSIDGGDDSFVDYYKMQPYDLVDMDKVFAYGDNKTCKDPNLNPAIDNLYTYNGGSNPYNWTMSAILGQSYELTEQYYEFQYTDEAGNTQMYDRVSKVTVKNKNGTSEDSVGVQAYVKGGETASVEFNNYYTQTGTGMFIVKKLSSVTRLPLAGAEFSLYDSSDNLLYTESTDADGEAAFYNLKEGTYTLKETKAPDGFTASQTTWSIVVDADGKVTCGNQTLYEVKKEINDEDKAITFNPLEITNAPDKMTVKVIKQFVGISKDQVDSLANDYSIVMQPKVSGNRTYTLKLTENDGITPVVSADGLTYTWTLTNVPEIGYTVTESQFKLKNYVTTVSVEGFKDGDYTTSVTDPVVANDTATFEATFNKDHEDGFTIYNSYANDFSMQIKKVDSVDKTKTLSGATFEVYGPHFIATDQRNVEVAGQTLYYLGTVTTDANGMATFNGWYTGDDDKVFHKLVLGYSYALVETEAPDGYNLLTEPLYLGVVNAEGVDWGNESYPDPNLVFSNGVYSITVENQPGYELPMSGGTGTYLYTLGGLLLTMAAILMYNLINKRRKEELASS